MEEIIIPEVIERELLRILSQSKEANLLLQGFVSGKELQGTIALEGSFKLNVKEPSSTTP